MCFGFMDIFKNAFTANFIDDEKRYRYSAQPSMVKWDLERLLDALSANKFVNDNKEPQDWWKNTKPLLQKSVGLDILRNNFDTRYKFCYDARMSLRLGLPMEQSTKKTKLTNFFFCLDRTKSM
eukprot:UN10620